MGFPGADSPPPFSYFSTPSKVQISVLFQVSAPSQLALCFLVGGASSPKEFPETGSSFSFSASTLEPGL